MKSAVHLLVLFILFTGCAFKQNEHLFPINENNRVGYINAEGRIVIPPIFREAGGFSEDLAPARMDGLFGYINKKGEFVIQPAFERATDFHEGFAVVYNDKRAFFINKLGKSSFSVDFENLATFKNGLAVVKTKAGHCGAIDTTGRLIIDTLYQWVRPTEENLFILQNRDPDTGMDSSSLVDNRGKTIVPFGIYSKIDDFSEGNAHVVTHPLPNDTLDNTTQEGIIDVSGKLFFLKPRTVESGSIFGAMVEGLAEIILFKPQFHNNPKLMFSTDMTYHGIINRNGEVVLNDTLINSVSVFSEGRAEIHYRDSCSFLINQKMQKVRDTPLSLSTWFQNGVAAARDTSEEYGLIDTNGNFLFKPRFQEIKFIEVDAGCFLFSEHRPTSDNEYRQLYGIANTKGEILLEPTFEDYDRNGFKNGLMTVFIDGRSAYINPIGRIVWQEKSITIVEDLNITHKDAGIFYATSTPHPDDYGGYGRNTNFPQKIEDEQPFPGNAISVNVVDNQTVVIDNRWNGFRVFVANTMPIPVLFNASDSRLEMVVQALNSKNEWQNISFLPSSFCGNSYHTLTLASGEYWAFEVPKYAGDFKTKIRIALTYVDPSSKDRSLRYAPSKTVYSNTFDASINPAQFWYTGSHSPSNLMDPYAF